MGRIKPDLLARVEAFSDRVLEVAEALSKRKLPPRLLGQIVAAGTSVGANLFEADEAMSRSDFCKCLAIAVKELNETRYWIRLAGRRGWIPSGRLSALEQECRELMLIFGTMISRTRARSAPASAVNQA